MRQRCHRGGSCSSQDERTACKSRSFVDREEWTDMSESPDEVVA